MSEMPAEDTGGGGSSSIGGGSEVPAGPVASGDLTIENLGGKRWKVTLGGKWVAFTFCTAGGTDRSGRPWPYKLDSIGPRCTNLEFGGGANHQVDVTPELLRRVGLTSGGWPTLMAGIANSESGGNYGSLNTYDTEIVSWGAYQFSGKRGPLTMLLAGIQSNPLTASIFENYFGRFGLHSVLHNVRHPNWGGIVTIKVCDFRSDPGCQRSTSTEVKRAKPAHRAADRIEEGWVYLRSRPDLLGLFYLAGKDPLIAASQVKSRADSFKRAYSLGSAGTRVRDYVTSEYAVARWAYSVNGSPAGARAKFEAMRARHPRGPWTRAQLAEYTATLHAVPRFEAGGGARLSKDPGSFRAE
jgi:hypothetical protein